MNKRPNRKNYVKYHTRGVDEVSYQKDLEAYTDELEALLGEFVSINDDDCSFDHHGYCQTHYLQYKGDCMVRKAKNLLTKQEVNKVVPG